MKIITAEFVHTAYASDVQTRGAAMDPRNHVGQLVVKELAERLKAGDAVRIRQSAEIRAFPVGPHDRSWCG